LNSDDGNLLREALEASEIAYWSYDFAEKTVFLSDRYYTMLGYEPGAFPMTLEGWTALLHPEEAESVLGALHRFFESERAGFQMEYRLRTANAGWRWVQLRARVVERDRNDEPKRVSGINIEITQRKLMERALLESESRWNSLVDEAPLGTILVDRKGQILFVNRFEAELYESMSVGRNWKEFIPEELHSEVDEILKKGFLEGLPRVFETYSVRNHSFLTHFENHISPLRQDGKVTALLIVSLNVTSQYRARKRQATAAHRMEILLSLNNEHNADERNLFTSALDAAIDLTDSEMGYVFRYSDETSRLKLYSWSTATFDRLEEAPVTSGQDENGGLFQEAVRRREPTIINDWQSSPTLVMEPVPFQELLRRILVVPLFEGEEVVAVIGLANKFLPYSEDDAEEIQIFFSGILQLRHHLQTEETLKRLYQAVEYSPVSVVITDREGRIVYANSRFVESTGLAIEQILGHPHQLLNPDIVGEESYRDMVATISDGREWRGELSGKRKDGVPFTEWVSLSAVKNAEGKITHYLAVEEDITERKTAQELLSRAQRMETVGQLAAGVAHDFNNLLTSLLAYNEMLLRKITPGDPLRVYSEKIELSGRRAAALVSGLLAIGRQQRLTKVRTDLGQLLLETKPLLESLTNGRIRFEVEDQGGSLPVEVDLSQINQVAVNLVSNAKDATESLESDIVVSYGRTADEKGEWAWFSVQDQGSGIPHELLDKVFEPFFTTKPIGKGTGLGLSVVHGIVQQHQGSIIVKSEAGQGTTFIVSLPLLNSDV
jgi:PAS domain S-box-containing protein